MSGNKKKKSGKKKQETIFDESEFLNEEKEEEGKFISKKINKTTKVTYEEDEEEEEDDKEEEEEEDEKDNYLICPCCQQEYNQPKMLPCLHSFCHECLESNLTQSEIGPGEAFLCPICKTQCTVPARGVRAMKSNIFLVTLQEFLHSKILDEETECEACDSSKPAKKKCIECNDWLCGQCCAMHLKVKITRDHHLVGPQELSSGKYDQLIKENFEPLLCSKHNEPLKLYCCYPGCQAAICTICKTTSVHENHEAIELIEQAKKEAEYMKSLLPRTKKLITTTAEKISALELEEKRMLKMRENLHKSINERTQEVLERLVRRIQRYAESILTKVEEVSRDHQHQLEMESEECRNNLQAAVSAKTFAEALLSFDRPEELVSMAREVRSRLEDFQHPVDPVPPAWKEPRLNPSAAIEEDELDAGADRLMAKLFGELTFEGEAMSRSVPLSSRAFSAKWTQDERECALCDVTMDDQGNIIVVDKENKRVKKFDEDGKLIMLTDEEAELNSPNRILYLKNRNLLLVKDEKELKLFSMEGNNEGIFTDRLKQAVGLALDKENNVMVTEWMTREVVILDENGFKIRSFPISCEAPGYLTSCPNGNIVVSDWKMHVIKIFDYSGKFLKQYGERGSGPGQLDHPYGVCSDKYNHIIVCDTWNHRVVLLSEEGHFMKVIVDTADGLQWPQAVLIDPFGRLSVVEQHGLVKFFKYLA